MDGDPERGTGLTSDINSCMTRDIRYLEYRGKDWICRDKRERGGLLIFQYTCVARRMKLFNTSPNISICFCIRPVLIARINLYSYSPKNIKLNIFV